MINPSFIVTIWLIPTVFCGHQKYLSYSITTKLEQSKNWELQNIRYNRIIIEICTRSYPA